MLPQRHGLRVIDTTFVSRTYRNYKLLKTGNDCATLTASNAIKSNTRSLLAVSEQVVESKRFGELIPACCTEASGELSIPSRRVSALSMLDCTVGRPVSRCTLAWHHDGSTLRKCLSCRIAPPSTRGGSDPITFPYLSKNRDSLMISFSFRFHVLRTN